MSFKKCPVVMLPTNEKAIINLNEYRKDVPTLNHSKEISNYETNPYQLIRDRGYQPQHLYILSNEKIKEGDWVYENNLNQETNIYQVFKINNELGFFRFKNVWIPLNKQNSAKKIIATTDRLSVLIDDGYLAKESPTGKVIDYLPQPSQSFIQKFVEEYRKCNIITEVMVEYEEGKSYSGNEGLIVKEWLKINPKDNTITIRKVKDSWNREEVKNLISKAFSSDLINTQSATELDKWIEENL